MENAKIKKFKCDILSEFQTMCASQRDSFEKNVLRTLILQAMMIEKLIVDGRSKNQSNQA